MTKLIISDFDGVLLKIKDIHYKALNLALEQVDKRFVISYDDHVRLYDGLSTNKKLNLLVSKGFSKANIDKTNELKQYFTQQLLESFNDIDEHLFDTVTKLKQDGFLFYVASNAIRSTVITGLRKLDILHLVDVIYSNEDVNLPKPNPSIYLKCMSDAGVSPHETVIIEDSKHGKESAYRSKAHVYGVSGPADVTYDKLLKFIKALPSEVIKHPGKPKLTVLIPMSGFGSRFSKAGYDVPKPLLDVMGKPMIQRVVENVNVEAKFIFIVRKEHCEKFCLELYLKTMCPGCEVVITDQVTEGAACSVLLAKEHINNDDNLFIINSDQYIIWDSLDFFYNIQCSEADGGILTFTDTNPKWSFVKTDESGYVTELAEKKVISDKATVGAYWFNKGSEFVSWAESMIEKNLRVNGEFYVAPVYNEAIIQGKKIKTYDIEKMYGLGTPEDYESFLSIVRAGEIKLD